MPDKSVVFDKAAGYYDETRGFPPGVDLEVGQFIASEAGLTADAQVVEIGVGTGRIALPLAKHIGRLVGVDLSTQMMRRLLQKHQWREYTGTNINLVEGDVMNLPLAGERFDAAVATHIFHLIPDPDAAAKEVARVLKPGGLMLNCRNRHENSYFKPMVDAWDQVVQESIYRRGDTSWSRAFTLFEELGWPQVGEERRFHYSFQRTPAQTFDQYRRRVFSSMWSMPDDVFQNGIEAMESAMQQHYPNPDEVHDIPSDFIVQIYRRPA
jgi:ubiquinone/menaquinone biosynthesis C-methylase UbiE